MKAYTVTLTTQDTNYNLLALVRAGDSTFVDVAKDIQIQALDDAGAQIIRVGDSNLSDTVYAYSLLCGDFGPVHREGSLLGMYARSNVAAKKICIRVER